MPTGVPELLQSRPFTQALRPNPAKDLKCQILGPLQKGAKIHP